MVLSMKKARSICADIVAERYPGFRLLADRLADGAYIALWGLGSQRLEVIFACRGNEDISLRFRVCANEHSRSKQLNLLKAARKVERGAPAPLPYILAR